MVNNQLQLQAIFQNLHFVPTPAAYSDSPGFLSVFSLPIHGVPYFTARITAALCDVTSGISKKTSDKSVLILVSNSQTPRSCAPRNTVGQAHGSARGKAQRRCVDRCSLLFISGDVLMSDASI